MERKELGKRLGIRVGYKKGLCFVSNLAHFVLMDVWEVVIEVKMLV